MKAINIAFSGYRRLRDAKCNTDGKLIAFLGPNEAGKSSVLDALDWFSNGQGPLAWTDRYRPNKPADDAVILTVKYRLLENDLAAIDDLGLAIGSQPSTITVTKTAGGHRRLEQWDAPPTRDPAPFRRASEALDAVPSGSSSVDESDEDAHFADLRSQVDAAIALLDQFDRSHTDEDLEPLRAIERLLRSAVSEADNEANRSEQFNTAAEAVYVALRAFETPHPRDPVAKLLLSRVPAFILFTDDDRNLRSSYDLSEDEIRVQPPAALRNLLTVAETTPARLWEVMQSGDRTEFRSMESVINARLAERIKTSWRQSLLTINILLNTDGRLEVSIEELDTGESGAPVVDFSERSDGLRTFMALNCFLGARDRTLPPILLIDEAETHLHYDAQADLLSLLHADAEVGQVFYTTHSPGCLPLDLGTGLRFVARSETDSRDSILENSFWAKDTPGFSRLLFAMGAGAAAFSAFRRAVLSEGATEMILLPTLLRLANDDAVLDFQVAPGLSNANSVDPALREVAVHTAFVVDGDDGGDVRRDSLLAAGFEESVIVQLPPGMAIEDLLDRESYLDVVDTLMREAGQDRQVDRSALDDGLTIAKAVDSWCASNDCRAPSHVIVAARLASEPDKIKLAEAGREALQAIYSQVNDALA